MEIRTNKEEVDVRFFKSEIKFEKRTEGEPGVFLGYGAVFNELSDNLGGFREKIEPGAFDSVMNDDVRGLFNHNINFVLGRSSASTLSLSVDKVGVRYEIIDPETSFSNDLAKSIQRGDIKESSFSFMVARRGDEWEEDQETGIMIRTVTKLSRFIDLGPVTFAAYPQTTAAKRSLDLWNKDNKKESYSVDDFEMRLKLRQRQIKR